MTTRSAVGSELPQGADKRRAVIGMFDRVAPRYERMNRVISLGLAGRWRRRAVSELGGLRAGSTVLDLACGTGDICRELAGAGYHPVGVDLSAGMLAEADTTTPLVRGDALTLPFASESFDGVICGFALRNFVALDPVFRECARVLRPGGRFVALDAAVPSNGFVRAGNTLWFRRMVPLLGRLLAHDGAAYGYLPRSTAYLPPPDGLRGALRDCGFDAATTVLMTGGSVQLLTGDRR